MKSLLILTNLKALALNVIDLSILDNEEHFGFSVKDE